MSGIAPGAKALVFFTSLNVAAEQAAEN